MSADLLGLVLHRDHSDEYLIALGHKAVFDDLNVDVTAGAGTSAARPIRVNEQRVGAAMVTHVLAVYLVSFGVVMAFPRTSK